MLDINLEILRYQRLADLGRDLEGFVHNVAGPLNIILGYTQVLQAKYPEDPGLSRVWEAGMDLDRNLKELSSHLEDSGMQLRRLVDINGVILRKMELLRANNFFKHNIESVVEPADGSPKVKAVYGDVVICLNIILNNAIDALFESAIRKIVVRSNLENSDKGRMVKITVRDTGDGIDEEKRLKYFDLGFSDWQKGEIKKSGAGLTLARYIMEQNGGSITLENSCGCGAEAALYFPAGEIDEV